MTPPRSEPAPQVATVTYGGMGRLVVGPAEGLSARVVLPAGVPIEIPAEDARRLMATSRARHLTADIPEPAPAGAAPGPPQGDDPTPAIPADDPQED